MGDARNVNALFNYLDVDQGKPAYYLYQPDNEEPIERPKNAKHLMKVTDVRSRLGDLSLDVEGIEMLSSASNVPDFYDSESVKATYYPEVEEIVREHTGATKVLVFDHNVRCGPRHDAGEKGVSSPVRFAHNDYTIDSGPQRVKDLLPDEADYLLKYRFAVINVWRPINHPVQDVPLAVCDASTMEQKDFVATDLVYPDRTGEIYSVKHQNRHRWFFVSDMKPDEVMLLKCYDSDATVARFTAHSAFNDPEAPEGAPSRESIEARTLAFFAPEA